MQIQGLGNVNGAQRVTNAHGPHNARPAPHVRGDSLNIDQLDISPEADLVSRARDLPDVRQERIDSIRAQIEAGTYETEAKLNAALSSLLDEIA
ncbi:MAG: flagellar biosynthesis anti-sigma factor FlgM [Planctomycetales bacterium]|nr:flagellar biosynthesis anti-sigma factor FlgM [Planctomycetales bacterium]